MAGKHPVSDLRARLSPNRRARAARRTKVLLKKIDSAALDRLAAVLARAEALAKGRDAAADDAALAPFGEVDPVNWSVEAVRALMAKRR